MNINKTQKRLLCFLFSLIIVLTSFPFVFAVEGEEVSEEVSEEISPEVSTPTEESVPSEESNESVESTPDEESNPDDESNPEEEPDLPIEDFDGLKAAFESGKTVIEINGTIEFSSPITLPEASFSVSGGKLKNAQFDGNGKITFSGTTLSGYVDVTDNVTLKIEGNAPSIIASGSSHVTVSGNVRSEGDGIVVSDEATAIIQGNIDAKGVGVVAHGGEITIKGNVKSESDGVQFTDLSALIKIGKITAQSGVMYRDLNGKGGLIPSYSLEDTVTFVSSGEILMMYDSALFTFHTINSEDVSSIKLITYGIYFPDADINGFNLSKTFTLTAENCTADVKYTSSYRKGAECKVIKVDSEGTHEMYHGKYEGSFNLSNVEGSTFALFFTTRKYTVAILSNQNGTLRCDKSTYYEGETVQFTAIPKDMWRPDKIIINGEEFSMNGDTYKHVIMSDIEATPKFAAEKKQYTVTIRQTTGGTVSRKGTVTVFEGDSLTLTMTPDDGYYLSMIEINKELMERKETYTIENITEDLIVFITFKMTKRYSIVLKKTAGGTVTADDASVEYGGSTKIRIKPDEGYVIDKVIADFGTLTSTSDPNVYRLRGITVDVIVTVSFKRSDGTTPEPPDPMNSVLTTADVDWDIHPIRLELFDHGIISEEVIEMIAQNYPNVDFSIIGKTFNWYFKAGDAEKFPEGDIRFDIKTNSSAYEESHKAFSGSNDYISVTLCEGLPTIGELKIFVGRAYLGLPFYSYSFDGSSYSKISETVCDAYFEITIPLGCPEVLMLAGGNPANVITIITEGDGTASPKTTQYIKDGESLKIIFTPSETSFISKVTVNGEERKINGEVLMLENIQENIDVVCIFLPHVSREVSRYQLPVVRNKLEVVAYIFLFVGLAALVVYVVMRRTGIIKYKNEL